MTDHWLSKGSGIGKAQIAPVGNKNNKSYQVPFYVFICTRKNLIQDLFQLKAELNQKDLD